MGYLNWYRLVYIDRYNKERAHTMSGAPSSIREVMQRYRIEVEDVRSFVVNGIESDLRTEING